ncbi:Zinc finger MYND-type [Trinorchestia longiramus]|nr:Zinc finger MYND-type [Trinorchestia longiramus]
MREGFNQIKFHLKMSVDDINPGEGKVALGFLEEAEPWMLRSKFFPSKVGGQPAWLALDNIPSVQRLSYDYLLNLEHQYFVILERVYSLNLEHGYSFHRTIFLFVCRDGRCCQPNSSKGIKAFRCQLPRKNPYYSYEPPAIKELNSHTPSARDHLSLCSVCGGRGDKVCSQCHCVQYCSKAHQSLHWRLGHKQECKNLCSTPGTSSVSALNSFLFPEKEVILEPQDDSSDSEDDDAELTDDQIRQQLGQFSNAQTMPDTQSDLEDVDSLEAVAKVDVDPTFTAFKEIMDEQPDQVLRYHRRGEPLYCSQHPKPVKGKKHICPNCSKLRSFEFQVMPQMLNHLKLDQKEDASLDWGVLLVFTCHCDTKFGYVEELVFKQDYSDNAPTHSVPDQ